MTAQSRFESAAAEPPLAADRPSIVAAKRYGSQLITSGQTAHVDGTNIATGIVGADVDLETARKCAWQCSINVVAAAQAELDDLDQITAITRVTVYVASTAEFTDQHLVGDAATLYFHEVFGAEIGAHTRAALGVASLPTGSPVEVEAIFQIA